ncbi:MAG: hypothetical protein FWD28_02525 [Treponema sp.]|nr:hypothetical protein [Treponema sp.]
MKRIVFLLILFSLFFTSVYNTYAQNNRLNVNEPTTVTFDPSEMSQWARDVRRFEIIAFGTFPFSLFVVSFVTDMIRWNNANGMDFSEQGRRYAPWPLKSAGAIEMSNDEIFRTFFIAAGVSLTLALIDLIITNTKRNNERRRVESTPPGSIDIERIPYGEPEEDES